MEEIWKDIKGWEGNTKYQIMVELKHSTIGIEEKTL